MSIYCVTIDGILELVLKGKDVILCRETAASYLGISNGWGIPVRVYTEDSTIINSSYIKSIRRSSRNNIDIIKVAGVSCTTKEYTICDMILHDCDDQTILESIANYYFENNENIEKLIDKADQLGVSDSLNYYVTHAKEYYND